MNAGVILFLIFAVCVLIGVPISMSLGIGSLAAVALGNLGVSPAVIAQRVFGGLQSTSIMAIAFFILAGNLMAGGGISRRIVNFANCLIGNIRGGMSVALVIACAFFAALSGSAPATVVAIGSMLYADMVKQGYPEDRTAGLLVIAGGSACLYPLACDRILLKRDWPLSALAALVLGIFLFGDQRISRGEALILLAMFGAVLFMQLKDMQEFRANAELLLLHPVQEQQIL